MEKKKQKDLYMQNKKKRKKEKERSSLGAWNQNIKLTLRINLSGSDLNFSVISARNSRVTLPKTPR